MKYLSIKSFDDLQHYKRKDWSPPWIKLYNRLLDDYRFLQMSETAQLHLIKLWLLASRHDNRIPNDLTHISRAIDAKSAVDLDELIISGFVIPTDDPPARKVKRRKRKQAIRDSRIVLEDSYKDSTPDKKRKEESIEKKQPRGGWVGRFGEALTSATKGTYSPGRLGSELKELVDRDGEERVFSAWLAFLDSNERRFGPGYFAKNYGDYSGDVRPKLVGVGGEPTPDELRRAGIFLS